MQIARYFCQIVIESEVSRRIFEKYSYFMKIRPIRDELFHADGQTDIEAGLMKLIVAFTQFCEKRLKSITIRSTLMISH